MQLWHDGGGDTVSSISCRVLQLQMCIGMFSCFQIFYTMKHNAKTPLWPHGVITAALLYGERKVFVDLLSEKDLELRRHGNLFGTNIIQQKVQMSDRSRTLGIVHLHFQVEQSVQPFFNLKNSCQLDPSSKLKASSTFIWMLWKHMIQIDL